MHNEDGAADVVYYRTNERKKKEKEKKKKLRNKTVVNQSICYHII